MLYEEGGGVGQRRLGLLTEVLDALMLELGKPRGPAAQPLRARERGEVLEDERLLPTQF